MKFGALNIAVEQAESGKTEEDLFPVMEENLQALRLFTSLWTQWRYQRRGKQLLWTGLDYTAVASVLELATPKRKKRRRLFAALREMEVAALPVLNGGQPHKGDEPWP